MPFAARFPLRRRLRPIAPSCRGGASSLLRLAQPGQRAVELATWLRRGATSLAPAAAPSIITPLAPSRPLAPR